MGAKCWDKWLKSFIPNIGNEGWNVKVRETRVMTINSNYCPLGVPSMCTWGLFIEIVTSGNYNVRNTPIHLP
jgi:hypothetical protein